jgi:hypothetical protein
VKRTSRLNELNLPAKALKLKIKLGSNIFSMCINRELEASQTFSWKYVERVGSILEALPAHYLCVTGFLSHFQSFSRRKNRKNIKEAKWKWIGSAVEVDVEVVFGSG